MRRSAVRVACSALASQAVQGRERLVALVAAVSSGMRLCLVVRCSVCVRISISNVGRLLANGGSDRGRSPRALVAARDCRVRHRVDRHLCMLCAVMSGSGQLYCARSLSASFSSRRPVAAVASRLPALPDLRGRGAAAAAVYSARKSPVRCAAQSCWPAGARSTAAR